MRNILTVLFFIVSSCLQAQLFLNQDLVGARNLRSEAQKLIKRFEENAPRMIDEVYEKSLPVGYSTLHMSETQFDLPIKRYVFGEVRFYYGYEMYTLIDGTRIFYLSLVESDCCDFVSIFINTNHNKSKVSITLTPTYKEQETSFFSYQEDLEYDIEIATAMAHINPTVSYGEKPLQIVEISIKTFLEKFKKVTENIWP